MFIAQECKLNIGKTSIFKNNFANQQGGALHWTNIKPNFIKESFINNSVLKKIINRLKYMEMIFHHLE